MKLMEIITGAERSKRLRAESFVEMNRQIDAARAADEAAGVVNPFRRMSDYVVMHEGGTEADCGPVWEYVRRASPNSDIVEDVKAALRSVHAR